MTEARRQLVVAAQRLKAVVHWLARFVEASSGARATRLVMVSVAVSLFAGVMFVSQLPRVLAGQYEFSNDDWEKSGVFIGPAGNFFSRDSETFADTICFIGPPQPGVDNSALMRSGDYAPPPKWATKLIVGSPPVETIQIIAIGWPFRSERILLHSDSSVLWWNIAPAQSVDRRSLLLIGFACNSAFYAVLVLPLVLVFIWLPLVAMRRVMRERADARAILGRCPACGYDLRQASACCPECGEPVKSHHRQ